MPKRKRFLGSFGLALIVAIGFATVYAIAGGWGLSIWEGLWRQSRVSESLDVRADGTPLIRGSAYDDYNEYKTYFRTLDGKEVPAKENAQGWLSAASLPVPRYSWGTFPLEGLHRIGRFSDAQDVLWYFVNDGARDGRGYFVGYDSQNKLRVGFIGRSGFRHDQPPVEDWFPMDGVKLNSDAALVCSGQGPYWYPHMYFLDNSVLEDFPKWKVEMISGDQLLQVDLRNRSVTTFMESPDLLAAGNLVAFAPEKSPTNAAKEAPRTGSEQYLAVRTADRVVILDGAGKQHSAYPIPKEFRDRSFSLYEVGKKTALLASGIGIREDTYSHGAELTWIDASGKVLRREKVALKGSGGSDEHREARLAAAIVPSPIALAFGAAVILPLEDMAAGKPGTYSTHLAHHLSVYAQPLLLVSLLSAVLAVLCWRRHRHYYLPASAMWFVFVLLTGLPGIVGYLFHRRWPVREACPTCQRIVPRDRDACAACGAEFRPPQRKGIEVFA